MKNHSKVVLGLAAMLGISAGTAAVSGFAWFTTQRTATMNLGTYKVGAGGANLSIIKGSTDVNCGTIVTDGKSLAVTPNSGKLADVSSKDGMQFYKATLKTTNDAVDTYIDETAKRGTPSAAWMSAVNTEQMVCVSWDVTLRNNAAGTKMDVYLSKAGNLFTAGNAGAEIEKLTHTVTEESKTTTSFQLHNKSTVKSVKVNSTALTKGASANGYEFDASTNTVSLTNITLAAGDEVEIEYIADYSDCYRMAILKGSDVVFLYTNSAHKNYVGDDGDGTLVETNTLASTEYCDQAYLGNISTHADGESHSKQKIVDELTNGADVTLKFVVWCEGTATPFEAPLANAVTSEFLLVGLTA